MIIRINFKKLIISLLIPIIVGSASSILTMGERNEYSNISKPPLSPPGVIFPIVWIILYILMGISLYLIWNSPESYIEKKKSYMLFALQLFLNFLWSPIFFTASAYLAAFVILVLMWISILLMILNFWKISKPAALLQIPYLLWVTFAGYLNLGVYLMNR